MSARRVFVKRIRSNAKFQWKVIRLAVDWTVAVYIVVPALLFAGFYYAQMWITPPAWFDSLPPGAILTFLYLYALSGTIRYFYEEADRLHFLQGEKWRDKFLRWGMAYSAVAALPGVAFVAALAAPLLLGRDRMPAGEFTLLFTWVYLMKIHLSLLGQFLGVRYRGLRLWAARIFVNAGAGAVFTAAARLLLPDPAAGLAACALLIVLLAFSIRARLRLRGAFLIDTERDLREKYKYAALLLSQHVSRRPSRPRSRPVLFRSSGRIFRRRTADNGLAEAAIKTFFRSGESFKMYVQITAVFIFGILTTAEGADGIVIWLGGGFILAYYARHYWMEAQKHKFLELFPWRPGVRVQAMETFILTAMLPGFLAIGAAALLQAFSWWLALLLLFTGGLFGAYAWAVLFTHRYNK